MGGMRQRKNAGGSRAFRTNVKNANDVSVYLVFVLLIIPRVSLKRGYLKKTLQGFFGQKRYTASQLWLRGNGVLIFLSKKFLNLCCLLMVMNEKSLRNIICIKNRSRRKYKLIWRAFFKCVRENYWKDLQPESATEIKKVN